MTENVTVIPLSPHAAIPMEMHIPYIFYVCVVFRFSPDICNIEVNKTSASLLYVRFSLETHATHVTNQQVIESLAAVITCALN